jgi:hypothetical protein
MNGKGDKWRGGWSEEYADNFSKIFNKKEKRMQYELVQKNSDEVISKIDASNLDNAIQFFMAIKQLNKEQFDELYFVREEETEE